MSKLSFETYGCSANHADTRLLEHYALQEGFTITDLEQSDVVVLNTCTVKGPTQTAIEKRIQELHSSGKKIIVAGCLAQADPQHPLLKDYSLLGPDTVDRIGEAVRGTLADSPVQITKRSKSPLPLVISDQSPELPFILSVSQGCLSACTFCMTKLARGNLRSHTIRHLRDTTREAVKRGHKEIYLTSQDTSAYGIDIGVTLADLLESLISIEGEFRIRIGMANPQHFAPFQEKLWPLFQSDKLYRFLHIPLQSGSNEVLEDMRRDHTVEDYLRIIQAGRTLYPDLTIATDIICGYPTETRGDHSKTLQAIRQSVPDAINISRFWPRPKTRAERLKQLPGQVVKSRSKEVTSLFHRVARARNRRWLGWSGEVFVVERQKGGGLLGRNQSYKQILLNNSPEISLGAKIHCTIKDYGQFDLRE